MLINRMTLLPDDVIQIIFEYLNALDKIFLNKKYYSKYNYLIDKYIIVGRYEYYIRDIIKKDYSFVFKELLNRNFINWLLMHNYKYKYVTYNDYIHFLLYYTNFNKANNCNYILNLELQLLGLKKDWRKNNRIINNK
jgi:hypothetical protein